MRKQNLAHRKHLFVFTFTFSWFTIFSQDYISIQHPIILSGKIGNIPKDESGQKTILLYFPRGSGIPPRTIRLNDNGHFRDSIAGPEGRYTLADGNFPYGLYLKPGNQYSLTYEAKGPLLGTVQLGGDDTLINRYFITKQQEKIFFNPSEEKTEDAFKHLLAEWKKKELKRLAPFSLPEKIARFEEKSIHYEYLFNLYLFMRFSEMRDSSFRLSPASIQELNIDYNNEEDYHLFSDYSSLVYEYYLKKLDSIQQVMLRKDNSFSLRQNRVKLLAQLIPNKHIRNNIISDIVLFDLKEVKDIERYYNDFLTYYTGDDEKIKEKAADAYLRLTRLKQGTPSPQFADYTNYSGGANSLQDYLGKMVFIDIWATWCGNCWNEFSYIRKMEEKYKGKNIVFLSISIDKDKEEWKKTIVEKKLPGIQLLAKSGDDLFFKEYAVYGIPRYILLDEKGKIINYSCPRPSDEEAISALFKKAGL